MLGLCERADMRHSNALYRDALITILIQVKLHGHCTTLVTTYLELVDVIWRLQEHLQPAFQTGQALLHRCGGPLPYATTVAGTARICWP